MEDNQQPTQTQQSTEQVMTGVKKRQQIKDLNKNTFIWLAVSAVIVSVALVAMQFLVREFLFNQKIISKKGETNKTLTQNIEEAEKLRESINNLLADPNLNALKYEAPNVETTALNVILDALPIEGDATNFANSLQAVVLPRSGVAIKDLSTATSLDGTLEATDVSASPVSSAQPLEVPFITGFGGDYQKIQSALSDLSLVIRPINLKKMTITATGENGLMVNIEGVTYYLPSKTVEIRKETLKP